jgi:tetratricopeptide (TPR) repeat protein
LQDQVERTSLHFRVLLQLGVAMTGRYGYSAPEAEDVYRRAHQVCGDRADAETLYPIIRGLAGANLLRGNHATAYDLSVQGLKLAEESGRPEFRIDALSMLCYTNLYFGRLGDCRGWIERCLELYQAEQGDRLTYPAPHDAGTAVLALLPTVAWLLGDSQAADQAICDGLAHVERLDRDFDRAFMHVWISGVRYTQRRYIEALEHAAILVEISQRHGYQLHLAQGTLLSLLSQSSISADPQALVKAREVCMALAREGVGLNAPYFLWGLALGYAKLGDSASAREMLAEGFRRAQATGETRMNAELLILQAEFEPGDEALPTLRRAFELAEEYGDVATALRANAALVLRSDRDRVQTEYAIATIAMLDGRQNYPANRDWMRQRLAVLQRIGDIESAALVGA